MLFFEFYFCFAADCVQVCSVNNRASFSGEEPSFFLYSSIRFLSKFRKNEMHFRMLEEQKYNAMMDKIMVVEFRACQFKNI